MYFTFCAEYGGRSRKYYVREATHANLNTSEYGFHFDVTLMHVHIFFIDRDPPVVLSMLTQSAPYSVLIYDSHFPGVTHNSSHSVRSAL